MATKDHGPSIKDDEQYEALRREGMSKERRRRESPTSRRAPPGQMSDVGVPPPKTMKIGPSKPQFRAREIGVSGYSGMSKSELITALREP